MVNLFTKCITCCSCFFLTYKPTTGYYRRSLLNLESNSSYYNILFINNTNLYNNYPLSFVKLTAPLQKAFCHFIRMGCLISTQLRKKTDQTYCDIAGNSLSVWYQSKLHLPWYCRSGFEKWIPADCLSRLVRQWQRQYHNKSAALANVICSCANCTVTGIWC